MSQKTHTSGKTPLTPVQYATAGGKKCPACWGEDLWPGNTQPEVGFYHNPMSCRICGAEWTEYAVVSGYQNLTLPTS